ncbi:MAG: cupin-like domain-containing protein [Halobacteriovoraceae bacterium]|jgi:hypothetical protein|nr:cupin-like domain-containing protein [Halobacteriovoraceae bacterium]
MNLKDVDIVEKFDDASFRQIYLEKGIPCVLKDRSKHWPALSKWNEDYLAEKLGEAEIGFSDAGFSEPGKNYMSTTKKMNFAEYLEQVKLGTNSLRVFAYNIKYYCKDLGADIKTLNIDMKISEFFCFLFVGSKGGETQFHYDIDMTHIFHTVIKGNKTFYLYDKSMSHNLYSHPYTVRSYVDVVNPDYDKYPRMKALEGYKVVLEPGDTLFIPTGYWHQVVYHEYSVAVSHRSRNESKLVFMEGVFNLFIMQLFDRFMNKLLGDSWFRYKERESFK